ncbi:fumarylacetoacetate hydrolase family protein [Pseudomonas putida]|uniref:Fumarylacetoacetate hydrolase family protein n=1 Tax=Pseudomonas putida TaxID=303 RepID=A0AAW6PU03_PSEPU|nr:fumarylacetoacetate hydrolase family protein [Pseudomonas putida]MDF3872858.1 fumarylacetoacetate hydrolase family protein [Pseudomonas putida]MDF3878195.1 fumarylacetoacetate hydrolase family protein [Pseudomonas putida]
MRFVTFRLKERKPRIGIAVPEGVVDIGLHLPGAPTDMIGLIAAWHGLKPSLVALVGSGRLDYFSEEVALLAPVPRPGKMLGIAMNYAGHCALGAGQRPTDQVWFAKMPTSANSPFGEVEIPRGATRIDCQAGLALVIGRRCRRVSRAEANQVIFGYCVAMDFSVNDRYLSDSELMLGKSFDTHGPFGPWIISADEIEDPHRLTLRCHVNGLKCQELYTGNLVFNCFEQIEHLSKVMTLEPGDVILTGASGGFGMALSPARGLHPGDVVRAEINEIGYVENMVICE